MLVFIAFVSLLGWMVMSQSGRRSLRKKSPDDWILDGVGLLIQGVVIPGLQVSVIAPLYQYLFPSYHHTFHINFITSFIISFVGIDYLYYWNHRGLHHRYFWQCHQTHHTMTAMDVLGTSRNTLWTSFLILYVWIHSLMLYLLDNSSGYWLGVSLTAALDLWRHSPFQPRGWLYRILSPWLMLPEDHAEHHRSDTPPTNYGANFKVWDRWHGTYHAPESSGSPLGITMKASLGQKLFFPW